MPQTVRGTEVGGWTWTWKERGTKVVGRAEKLRDWGREKNWKHHTSNDEIDHTTSNMQVLGAAGSVEVAISLLALRDRILPGTVNCDDPDPACPLNLTNQPHAIPKLKRLLKLSLGFGGHLGATVLERWQD